MLILVSIYLNCSISMINSLPNSSFGAIKKNIKKQIETWKNSVETENRYLCILTADVFHTRFTLSMSPYHEQG